jgi:hypothetical protein
MGKMRDVYKTLSKKFKVKRPLGRIGIVGTIILSHSLWKWNVIM